MISATCITIVDNLYVVYFKVNLSMVGIEVDNNNQMTPERHEISQMVKCRMHSLGQPTDDYGKISTSRDIM